MKRTDLTQSDLKKILAYNPDTGVFTWVLSPSTRIKAGDIAGTFCHGYWHIKVKGFVHGAHRLAWLYVYGVHPSNQVDHVNGMRSDNRIQNLREVNTSQNMQNQRKVRSDSKSGLIGATRQSLTGRWTSQIRTNGKSTFLGYFDSAEEAHIAYMEAKRKFHPFFTL